MAIHERDTLIGSTHGDFKRAFGVFKRPEDVEHVIHALKNTHYDMNRVSLLARNVDAVEGSKEIREQHGNEAKEGAGIGATTGTVLGGITGFLIGAGVLAIPGVGPVLAAGAEISALASTLAGAGAGALTGSIVGALVGLGIPEEKARVYDRQVKAGDYLLMVSGNDDDLHNVRSIMSDRNVEDFEIFEAPNTRHTETVGAYEASETRQPMTSPEGTVTGRYGIEPDKEPEVIVVDKRHEVR